MDLLGQFNLDPRFKGTVSMKLRSAVQVGGSRGSCLALADEFGMCLPSCAAVTKAHGACLSREFASTRGNFLSDLEPHSLYRGEYVLRLCNHPLSPIHVSSSCTSANLFLNLSPCLPPRVDVQSPLDGIDPVSSVSHRECCHSRVTTCQYRPSFNAQKTPLRLQAQNRVATVRRCQTRF
jgi:hypothetical protein